ncbi:MAG: hypothetical protein ACXW3D_03925 [Caulobacteraceae bacterium]
MTAPLVIVLIDLIQDIDVLAPVLHRLGREFRLKVIVSRWLRRESPRTEKILTSLGLSFSYVRRAEIIAGSRPGMRGVAAVLTASESSHPAHAAGHALARTARRAGAPSYTLQHGLENVGLSGPQAGETFASDIVFCWFPEGSASTSLAPETRAKLAHVGRPMLKLETSRPLFEVAVFENLHAEHYTSEDRAHFLAGLQTLVKSGCTVVLRPHPAGAWSEGLAASLGAEPNLTILGKDDLRNNPADAAETIRSARRVITTPSTVALDAAQADKPVALALAGGPPYAGLPVLKDGADWLACAAGGLDDLAAGRAFITRSVAPGDAAARIVERIALDIQQNA